jgi:hypothetical protein
VNKVHIIGAGLSGLLAANMLRHRATIFEQQAELPNNHSALLRFRTGVFGTAIGIPFKEVNMIKGVYGDNSNPIRNALLYSLKVTGQARTDRSILQSFAQEKRYIAPRDLVKRMAEGLEIRYKSALHDSDGEMKQATISTIPMPALMEILEYPYRKEVQFRSRSGITITATIANADAYATLYYPTSDETPYRVSITGNKLIIEMMDDSAPALGGEYPKLGPPSIFAEYYAFHFGFNAKDISEVQAKSQAYAKILPIDDEIRKDFMHWATDRHNIYSLGRYATWRPNLLLDDLVQDVSLISQWINKGGKYGAARHRQGSLL